MEWLSQFPELYGVDFQVPETSVEFALNLVPLTGGLENWRWLSGYAVFSSGYWSRVWIQQETVLAKSLLIFCDSNFIEAEKLEFVIERLREFEDNPATATLRPPSFLQQIRWARITGASY